jgi:ABC-2 type transport system ATP-binding protein
MPDATPVTSNPAERPASPAMIEVKGLAKRFGAVPAVDGIGFTVRRGEVLGFLGPNGAGKSTTMKMIAGFLTPSAGTIRVCGVDIAGDPIGVRERIGYLPEGAPAYPDMTPREFLDFCADVRGLKGARRRGALEVAIGRAALDPVLEQPIETLSKGFKRRVGFAQAILHDPPVLIMDEPTDGLDPNQKNEARNLIRAMAEDKAILISTHLLEEVGAICSRVVIIDRGRLVADGTPESMLARSRHHNAVRLVLDGADAVAAREALPRIPGVERVEEAADEDGATAFVLLPRDGGMIVADVAEFVRERNWRLRGLTVERGRLEEVFRALTTHDTAGADAADTADTAAEGAP